MNPAGGNGPDRRECLAQLGRRLRTVDPDVEILAKVNRFQAAGDVGNRFQPGDHGVELDFQRPGQGGGGQGAADLPGTDQADLDGRGPVETMEQEP